MNDRDFAFCKKKKKRFPLKINPLPHKKPPLSVALLWILWNKESNINPKIEKASIDAVSSFQLLFMLFFLFAHFYSLFGSVWLNDPFIILCKFIYV